MIKTDWVPTLEEHEKERIIKILKRTKGREYGKSVEEVAEHISNLLYKKEAYQYWPKRTKYGENWIYEVAERTAQQLLHNKDGIKKEHIADILKNNVLSVHRENKEKSILSDLHHTLKRLNREMRR